MTDKHEEPTPATRAEVAAQLARLALGDSQRELADMQDGVPRGVTRTPHWLDRDEGGQDRIDSDRRDFNWSGT